MKLGVVIPNNADLPLGFVKSVLALRGKYELFIKEGCTVWQNRNELMEWMRLEKDDLLLLDSDVVFTPEDVEKMREHLETRDIITGVCVLGYHPHPPSLFRKDSGRYRLLEPPKEIEEIDGCGGAFLGISRKVIETVPEPFFPVRENEREHGNDISFCIRAQKEGFKIVVDPSINVGHIRPDIKYYV